MDNPESGIPTATTTAILFVPDTSEWQGLAILLREIERMGEDLQKRGSLSMDNPDYPEPGTPTATAITTPALLAPDASSEWQELAVAARDVLAQIAPASRRVYAHDFRVFLVWMQSQDETPTTLSRSALIAYQAHLLENYARATAARMIAATKSLLSEWSLRTGRANPATGLKPIRLANESTHVALTMQQALHLLAIIDRSTLKGKRDYALILLLLKTGIRRSEAAALTIGDLRVMSGHRVAVIEHGKGDHRRVVKLVPVVWKAISAYLDAAYRSQAGPDEPLFVQIRKGGHAQREGLSAKGIERIVKDLALQIEEDDLTPHGLRATFITLALEAKAPLHMVQFAAGHARPETTERYHRRKDNLDDNAADYLPGLA